MNERLRLLLLGGSGPRGGWILEEEAREEIHDTVTLMYAANVCGPYNVLAPSYLWML